MKIRIPRQDFLTGVNKVKSVVSSRSALPILSHILIETGESSTRLCTTDLKVSIECSVDCTVDEPGMLTISSHRLASILTELPEGEVTVELGDNNVISLISGRTKAKLFSMSPDEFPPVRTFEGVDPIVIEQLALRDLFSKTSFAICTDQARYNLTGLLFEVSGSKLTVVATDGRRMSLCMQECGDLQDRELKIIIPGKMIVELERLLSDEGQLELLVTESQAAFVFNSIRMVTALIEGTFPDYNMVVPKSHDKIVLVDTVKFSEAVRRTRTMTNEKFNSVRFVIQENLLTLRVVTPEVGESTEDMEIEYTGDEVEIAFNPTFVLDVLKHVTTEKVELVLKDPASPGLLKPHTPEAADSYLNVIMPIRI